MFTSIHSLISKLQEETQIRHARYIEFTKQAEEIEYPQAAKLFRAMIAAEKARLKLIVEALLLWNLIEMRTMIIMFARSVVMYPLKTCQTNAHCASLPAFSSRE